MNLQANLTKRQDEIAGLLVIGKAKKQAADMLNISTDTVVNHTRNIYEKLEINSLGELGVWWFVKKFNLSLSEVYKAALSLLFIALVSVNEINPDGVALRTRTNARTTKTVRRK